MRLEARPPNAEGIGGVTVRELVRAALRMRPDRLVVGEVRGGEALDMLQALNTGHDGSMSTIHANGTADALARLETLVLMADTGLPLAAVRAQIGVVHRRGRLRRPTPATACGASRRSRRSTAAWPVGVRALFERRDGPAGTRGAPDRARARRPEVSVPTGLSGVAVPW